MQGKSHLCFDIQLSLGQPIISNGEKIFNDQCYKCLFKGFVFDPTNPGVLIVQDKLEVNVNMPISLDHSIHNPDEKLLVLKEQNDKELSRLHAEVRSWNRKLSKNRETIECQNMIHFYELVIKEFEQWYTDNELKLPSEESGSSTLVVHKSQDEVDKDVKSPSKRIILSPGKREQLNGAIYEAVQNFIDEGQGTQEQAFIHVANNSNELFKIDLSKGQIEGRYKTEAKKRRKKG